MEVVMGLVQSFPDLLPQVGRSTDDLSVPVGQSGDPVDQRKRPRQRLNLHDRGQTEWQVGHDPALVPRLIDRTLINAEGGRTMPSTSSQPSAVLILKDAALQPGGTGPSARCVFYFMPDCTVGLKNAQINTSVHSVL
jgi:hypothetical protein